MQHFDRIRLLERERYMALLVQLQHPVADKAAFNHLIFLKCQLQIVQISIIVAILQNWEVRDAIIFILSQLAIAV